MGRKWSSKMKTMKKMITLLAVAALVLALAPAANAAATIVWDAPTAITSNENILNPSQVGEDGGVALNYNNDAATPGPLVVSVGVTPVTFQDTNTPFPGDGYDLNYVGSAVGADFKAVLDEARYNSGTMTTLSFTGLTAGSGVYQLQVFAAARTFTSTLGLNVGGSYVDNKAFSGGLSASLSTVDADAGYINGLVTLGSGETSFDLLTISETSWAHINALVLTPVVLPPAGTVFMIK
jgi:hypothetical protein